MTSVHPVLERQLRRHLGDAEAVPETLQELVRAVSDTYQAADADRELLERSLELSSQELLEANEEMRAVLQALPDLLFWTTEDGLILGYMVGQEEDLYTDRDLKGKHIQGIRHPTVGFAFSGGFETVRESGRSTVIEYSLELKGELRHYEARMVPQPGKIVLVIIRNITERKIWQDKLEYDVRRRTADLQRMNAILRKAIQRTDLANRTKTEFLANMSHELRTPLHNILSLAAFGEREATSADPDALADYFDQIHESGSLLLDLLNDLLDLSKLEAGQAHYEMEPLDLKTVLYSVVSEFERLCSDRNIGAFVGEISDDVLVFADHTRLSQVFRNVVSNAVKFAKTGFRVTVATDEPRQRVTVTIADDGPGVPETEREKVFDKFVQSSKTKSGAGGTGLGLSISREIVIGHNGSIWAEDSKSGGAVFCVELPIHAAGLGAEPTEAKSA